MVVLQRLGDRAAQDGGGMQPAGAVCRGDAGLSAAHGAGVAATVQPGDGDQSSQPGGVTVILGCACTDIRYRARAFDVRVSVCMDCGRVWKVWPEVQRHG
jgi:hypothetical protein